MITLEQAARARGEAALERADRPSQRRGLADDRVECRGRVVVARARGEVAVSYGDAGASFSRYASITDTPYEMWDSFGPYVETVRNAAFEDTLGASPLVEFSTNHGSSLPMAHTRNGTLALGLDATGLYYTPTVDQSRTDVADMLKAIERGDLVESSFKFRIDAGTWNEDFTQFSIDRVDLNRGDVSIVNFGANPFTADFSPRAVADPALVARRARLRALIDIHLAS